MKKGELFVILGGYEEEEPVFIGVYYALKDFEENEITQKAKTKDMQFVQYLEKYGLAEEKKIKTIYAPWFL